MGQILVKDAQGNLKWIDEDSEPAPATTRKAKRETGQTRKSPGFFERALEMVTPLGVVNRALDAAESGVAGETVRNFARRARDFKDEFASGVSMGADIRLNALQDAARNGGGYSDALESRRQDQIERRDRLGGFATPVNIAGSLFTPTVGAGVAIRGIQAARGGRVLGRAAQGIVGGSAAGAIAGGAGGVLDAPDLTDVGNVTSRGLTGAALGGVGGGVLGGALGAAAPTVGRALGGAYDATVGRLAGRARGVAGNEYRAANPRRMAEEAQGAAEDRFLDLMSPSRGGRTAERLDQMVGADIERGAQPTFADYSQAARGRALTLFNKGAKGSDETRDFLSDRANRRGGRLRNAISEIAGINTNTLARAEQRGMRQGRLARGEEQYSAPELDNPVEISPRLNELLNNSDFAGEEAHQVIRQAMSKASNTIQLNQRLGSPFNKVANAEAPLGNDIVPTPRTMDLVIRDLRAKASAAYKGNDPSTGDALNSVYKTIQSELRDANPHLAQVWEDQARGLAMEDASKFAEKLGNRIFTDPRNALDELTQELSRLGRGDQEQGALLAEEMRKAILSRVFDKTPSRTLPRKILNEVSDPNQPEARMLWDFIMGGNGKTDDLVKWIRAEMPAAELDARISGPQSQTGMANAMAREEALGSGDSMLGYAGRAGVGLATGNPAMAAGNATNLATRARDMVRGTTGRAEDARLLRLLTRQARPGDMTRLEQRRLQRQQRQLERRARRLNRTGRVVGNVSTYLTDQNEEY